MESNKQKLMKHFASVLRNLALGKETENLMSQNLAFYFSRKELIDMIKKCFDGSITKEHNLMELENKELLDLIGDELFIISYVTEKWSKETSEKKLIPEKQSPSVTRTQKPKPNDKKD